MTISMHTGFDSYKPFDYPADMVFGLPNCGLVAISIATQTPLLEVTEWYRTTYKPRGSWKGSTRSITYMQFLRLKNIWAVNTSYDKKRIRTVGDFAEWYAKPGRFYIIASRGHAMMVKDGWIGDQWAIEHADRHPNRNRRILHSWEILTPAIARADWSDWTI